MPPDLAITLLQMLEDNITVQGRSKIPPHLQLLAALRFFAEGGYQKGISKDYHHPVSQTTFSRCLKRVVVALSMIADKFITFPTTREERQEVTNNFLRYNRISGILGLIDCFVVKFVRPHINEEAFYHYKHLHSMNVQVVCDDKYIIRNLRICPGLKQGLNNDKFIWKYSDIRQHMIRLRQDANIVREEGNYYIIGDSGYTPSPILLIPIRNAPPLSREAAYTNELVRTRCKVKQTFGILTNVWQCISRRRVLHYRPQKVAQIIQACATLHNFRLLHGIEDDLPELNYINNNDDNVEQRHQENYIAGIAERNRLIQLYYN